MPALTDLPDEAVRLPLEDRARLALDLIRSLDGERDDGSDEEWAVEIERRSAEIDAGTAATMTLDEYRAHVRSRRASR